MPKLYKLLSLVATIGATSAGVERSFSCLKWLKSYTCNTMGWGRLSSLALLASEWTLVKSREKTAGRYDRAFPWKRTESIIYIYINWQFIWCRPKMSYPSLKYQQPPLSASRTLKISLKYTHVKREEFKHITEPCRGQRSPNWMSASMMVAWVYVPSLVMICQRAAEKLAYFVFGGFVVEFDWLSW